MQIDTRHFGKVDIEENKIILFPQGLPGFDNMKKFIILNEEDEELFSWLQSIDDPSIAFALIDVLKIMPEYDPLVSLEELKIIDVLDSDKDLENIVSYNIVVIPKDIKEMSVNLKAPVIINTKTYKGKQALASNDNYEIRHKIFDKINKEN